MPPILLALILLLAPGLHAADAADAAGAPAKPPPVDELVHDLRDFLPESERSRGSPDDQIPAFCVKPKATWSHYASYNRNGSGYLSRTELRAIVADLVNQLRDAYPDVYGAIDSDGHDTITNAKLQAYLHRQH